MRAEGMSRAVGTSHAEAGPEPGKCLAYSRNLKGVSCGWRQGGAPLGGPTHIFHLFLSLPLASQIASRAGSPGVGTGPGVDTGPYLSVGSTRGQLPASAQGHMTR